MIASEWNSLYEEISRCYPPSRKGRGFPVYSVEAFSLSLVSPSTQAEFSDVPSDLRTILGSLEGIHDFQSWVSHGFYFLDQQRLVFEHRNDCVLLSVKMREWNSFPSCTAMNLMSQVSEPSPPSQKVPHHKLSFSHCELLVPMIRARTAYSN